MPVRLFAGPGGPEDAGPPGDRTDGYDLTDAERDALVNKDVGAIYAIGTQPMIINGYCHALRYKKADYRPLLEAVAPKTERRSVRWQTS